MTVRESTHDVRSAADLADDALQRIVGLDLPPVIAGKGKVGQRLLAMVRDQIGRTREVHGPELGDDVSAFGQT